MSFWLSWLSRFVGAVSLFSLLQRAFAFGLSNVFSDLITYYRSLAHYLSAPLHLPPAVGEILLLGGILLGLIVRSALRFSFNYRQAQENAPYHRGIMGSMGWRISEGYREPVDAPPILISSVLTELFIMLVAISLFFALNAYARF